MYPNPQGQVLTEEQALALDDTFLAADPFAYFSARIAMIATAADRLADEDSESETPTTGTLAAVSAAIGHKVNWGATAVDRDAQVATDAFLVRHHAAESLVRFANAALNSNQASHASLWATLADDRSSNYVVAEGIRAALDTPDAVDRVCGATVPRGVLRALWCDARLPYALSVFAGWLEFATDILVTSKLDINGAHNKLKHGLAVRSRADLRLTFVTTQPIENEKVPLSALTGPDAVDIFDRPVLEAIAVPSRLEAPRLVSR